jgi:hypothetical protein
LSTPSPIFDPTPLAALFCEKPRAAGAAGASGQSASSGAAGAAAADKAKTPTVLDAKRTHIAGIVIRGLKLPLSELRAALVTLDTSVLTVDRLESLLSLLPTDSDREALARHRAVELPAGADPDADRDPVRYIRLMSEMPMCATRVRGMLFMQRLEGSLSSTRERVTALLRACEALEAEPAVRQVLRATLFAGNYLNAGAPPQSAERIIAAINAVPRPDTGAVDDENQHPQPVGLDKFFPAAARAAAAAKEAAAGGDGAGGDGAGGDGAGGDAGDGPPAARPRISAIPAAALGGGRRRVGGFRVEGLMKLAEARGFQSVAGAKLSLLNVVAREVGAAPGLVACRVLWDEAAKMSMAEIVGTVRELVEGHREIEVALMRKDDAGDGA